MSIYSKKVSVGQFAKKGEDFKDGDIVTILNEGKQVEGKFGLQDVFLVKFPTGDKNITFNQTSINNCVDAFGKDSVKWVGKEVRIWLILQNVQGKMIKVTYLSHPKADINEDGEFVLPSTEISPEGHIDPESIKF